MSSRDEAIRSAYRELFSEGWPVAEAAAKKTLGFAWAAPPSAQRRFQDEFIRAHIQAEPRKRATFKRLLTAFIRGAALVVISSARDFAETWRSLPDDRLKRLLQVRKPRATGEPFKQPKTRARHLELAWFVVERVIPLPELVQGNLKPGRHGPKHGVPWHLIRGEWNRAHPHPLEQMTSGETLKRSYYRGVSNSHLVREVLTQFQREVSEVCHHQEAHGPGSEAAISLVGVVAGMGKHWASPQRDALRRRLRRGAQDAISRLPQHVVRACEQARRAHGATLRERYRAAVTRRDLIARRILLVWWWGKDAWSKQGTELVEAPLRDWFLGEARGGQGSVWTRACSLLPFDFEGGHPLDRDKDRRPPPPR